MNEPVKTNNHLAQQDSAASYMQAVSGAITLMLEAGLKTYGQHPGVDAWFMALRHRGVQIPEIKTATAAFVSGECGKEFPTAGDFANWCIRQRRDLERESILLEQGKRIRELEDAELRRRNVEKYGTEDPTREQIDERAKEIGLNISEMLGTEL